MGERAHILQYDRTSAGGTVLDGLDDVCWNDGKLSYLGARVQCPACNSIGRIGPDGTRPDNDLAGRQPALAGDFCLCACSPKPTLIASQKDWTIAHECGHLFNSPDEYYDQGGWLHRMYIKEEQIDFNVVAEKKGKGVWQAVSNGDLMGYGCNNLIIPSNGVNADIDSYYGSYVAQEFSAMTGRVWRVGYAG